MINETDLSYVEAPMVAHDQYVAKEAGFWIRFFAFIFDNLVITALIGLLVNPVFYPPLWHQLPLHSWCIPAPIPSLLWFAI